MEKMRKKNSGFTLMELLAVIVLIGLIAVLIVPNINSMILDSRKDLYEKQIQLIESAARLWASETENRLLLENNQVWPYEITLGDLQESEYIEKNISNPKTDEIFHESMIISITKNGNTYNYTVIDEVDADAPVITLNGNSIEEIELKSAYEDLGAEAVSKEGYTLSVTKQIKKNGAPVDTIDTNSLGIYKIIYTARDNEKVTSLARTVKIVDTTPPVLTCSTCPSNNTFSLTLTDNYQLPEVTATDNSGENITVLKSGSFSSLILGERTVVYSATDSSGNRATLNVKFVVEEEVTEYAYKPNISTESYTFTAPYDGIYKIELWGASGGDIGTYQGGKGAYTKGNIYLKKDQKLYLYVGGAGSNTDVGGYNGGGSLFSGQSSYGASGGGATDIRLNNGNWGDFNSLKSRIMVAAGGGGANNRGLGYGAGNGGFGGTMKGGDGESAENMRTNPSNNSSWGWAIGTGGTQILGGDIVINGTNFLTGSEYLNRGLAGFGVGGKSQSGGGSGYYGGGSSIHGGAGGGSSFISGYSGCNAIDKNSTEENIVHTNQPNHYSGFVFTDSSMIMGSEEMPSYNGASTMVGNTGNGYARITLLSIQR